MKMYFNSFNFFTILSFKKGFKFNTFTGITTIQEKIWEWFEINIFMDVIIQKTSKISRIQWYVGGVYRTPVCPKWGDLLHYFNFQRSCFFEVGFHTVSKPNSVLKSIKFDFVGSFWKDFLHMARTWVVHVNWQNRFFIRERSFFASSFLVESSDILILALFNPARNRAFRIQGLVKRYFPIFSKLLALFSNSFRIEEYGAFCIFTINFLISSFFLNFSMAARSSAVYIIFTIVCYRLQKSVFQIIMHQNIKKLKFNLWVKNHGKTTVFKMVCGLCGHRYFDFKNVCNPQIFMFGTFRTTSLFKILIPSIFHYITPKISWRFAPDPILY